MTVDWRLTGLVMVMAPITAALGVWQLQRADAKAALEQRFEQAAQTLPVDGTTLTSRVLGARDRDPTSELAFKRVQLRGRYDSERYFLVDNRVHRGRAGYWVVQAFEELATDRYWLVNRGWIDGGARRETLPAVTSPAGTVTVVGVLWPTFGLPPLLADDPWVKTWPKRVQRLNVERMARALAGPPWELRLEPGQPGVLVPAPRRFAVASTRHIGYAWQWFGLTAVLIVGYGVLWRRARHASDRGDGSQTHDE